MDSKTLLDHRDAFIGFARARTGDPELAADLVQECLLKALRADHTPDDAEGVVTWFYRILRHAIIDAHRRTTSRDRALQRFANELPENPTADDERSICQCVLKLLPTLPPGDADLLRRVDLEGESPATLARHTEQRLNTVNVRLLRARRRLREKLQTVCRTCATHGCLDCNCG